MFVVWLGLFVVCVCCCGWLVWLLDLACWMLLFVACSALMLVVVGSCDCFFSMIVVDEWFCVSCVVVCLLLLFCLYRAMIFVAWCYFVLFLFSVCYSGCWLLLLLLLSVGCECCLLSVVVMCGLWLCLVVVACVLFAFVFGWYVCSCRCLSIVGADAFVVAVCCRC